MCCYPCHTIRNGILAIHILSSLSRPLLYVCQYFHLLTHSLSPYRYGRSVAHDNFSHLRCARTNRRTALTHTHTPCACIACVVHQINFHAFHDHSLTIMSHEWIHTAHITVVGKFFHYFSLPECACVRACACQCMCVRYCSLSLGVCVCSFYRIRSFVGWFVFPSLNRCDVWKRGCIYTSHTGWNFFLAEREQDCAPPPHTISKSVLLCAKVKIKCYYQMWMASATK